MYMVHHSEKGDTWYQAAQRKAYKKDILQVLPGQQVMEYFSSLSMCTIVVGDKTWQMWT